MDEKEFEEFFENEWNKRYVEKMPCDEVEDGCEDGMKEGTLIDAASSADRIMVYIKDYNKIVFFRELEGDDHYPFFKFGEDIFSGKTYELIPKIAESWLYQDNAVIFSEGNEIFSGETDIGHIIHEIVKAQDRLLELEVEKWDNR